MNHIDASTVGTAHDDGTVTITNRLPARLRCPKCGAEDGESWVTQQAPRLSISIAPFSGEYCLTCYARWVAENIPKLEPVYAVERSERRPQNS